LSEAAQTLAREFDLSLRQAYRYLEQASQLGHPVPVEEASIPITLKLPPSTVRLLRAYAASSGLTLGEAVTRALRAFLNALRENG
jgi:predicted DNA-binding transcriptional regulator YafY